MYLKWPSVLHQSAPNSFMISKFHKLPCLLGLNDKACKHLLLCNTLFLMRPWHLHLESSIIFSSLSLPNSQSHADLAQVLTTSLTLNSPQQPSLLLILHLTQILLPPHTISLTLKSPWPPSLLPILHLTQISLQVLTPRPKHDQLAALRHDPVVVVTDQINALQKFRSHALNLSCAFAIT